MNLKLIGMLFAILLINGCAMTARPNLPLAISSSEFHKGGYALLVGSLSRQNAAAIYDLWRINILNRPRFTRHQRALQ